MSNFKYEICALIINVIMSHVFPLAITFVLTILVICKLRKMNNRKDHVCPPGAFFRQSERKLSRSIRAVNVMTSAMIATNLAFVILTLPPTVFRVIWFFFQLEKINYFSLKGPIPSILVFYFTS